MSEKRELLSALFRVELGAAKVDFRALLSDLSRSVLGLTQADADAFSDANLRKYWNWLAQEVDSQAARGLTPFFSLAKGGVYALSSTSHAMMGSVDPQEQARGSLALSRPNVLSQIDAMNNREYEALACIACTAIGSGITLLTPPGNEGGIDFFATLSIQTKTHVLSGAGTELRIVGQCKKYASPVAVDKLEQFILTMQNVRHRSGRVLRHIPPWFDDSRGPVVGWIMAHSGFQIGAADEAKNHGIVTSDTLDLAELISMSNSYHGALSPPDRANRLIADCRRLL